MYDKNEETTPIINEEEENDTVSSNSDYSTLVNAIEVEDYATAKDFIGAKLSSLSVSKIDDMKQDVARKIYSIDVED